MKDRFIRAEELTKELGVSKAYAYKLIRQMNQELNEKGYMTVTGRVSRQYFYEKFYGMQREEA